MPEREFYDHFPEWLRKDIDTRLDPTGNMHFFDLHERVNLSSMFIIDLIFELNEEQELNSKEDYRILLDVLRSHKEYWCDALDEIKSRLTSLYRSAIYCGICKKRPFTHSVLRVCRPCYLLHRGEVQLVQVHLYRAKAVGVPATLTLGEWIETLQRFNSRCAYCEGPYEVLEHLIPLSRGGGTTAENCVPACQACNSKKRRKHLWSDTKIDASARQARADVPTLGSNDSIEDEEAIFRQTVYMPKSLARRLKIHASATDQDISGIITKLVEKYLAEEEGR